LSIERRKGEEFGSISAAAAFFPTIPHKNINKWTSWEGMVEPGYREFTESRIVINGSPKNCLLSLIILEYHVQETIIQYTLE